ncbi:MAG: hypothetical protein WC333_05315 [Dehalococcoidia bacterium]|jgi:hypothetical protein
MNKRTLLSLLLILTVISTGVSAIESESARADGWTLMDTSSLPSQSLNLFGIWGSSATDVFAVGYDVILHYDGTNWTLWQSGCELYDIWGTASNNIYAVGTGGKILYYDGYSWQEMGSGTGEDLLGIWGTSPNNLYAVGTHGTILNYNGVDSWQTISGGNQQILYGIWGSAYNNIYIVGASNSSKGLILHYNGTAWSETETSTNPLKGIWGSYAANIYAVGDDGTILQYTGSNWNPRTSGTTYNLNDIWGTSSSNIYAVGFYEVNSGQILRYSGGSWQKTSYSTPIFSIWGSSSSNIFAVGFPSESANTILRYSSSATPTTQPTPTDTHTPNGTATPTSAPGSTPTQTASPNGMPTSTIIIPTYTPTSTASVTPTPTPSPTPTPVDSTPWYKGTWFGIWIAAFWLIAAGAITWMVLKQRRPHVKSGKKVNSSQQAKDKK